MSTPQTQGLEAEEYDSLPMVDHAANNSLPMADTMRSDAEPPMVAKPEPDSDSDLEKQAPAPSGKAFGAAATTTLPPPAPPASSNKRRVCGLSVFWFCCVVAAIIIVLAVALGAGLGAGLKKGNNNNKSSDSSSGSSSSSSLPVSSTTTISSTTSAISSSASASSTEASSSVGVQSKVYVQTNTATVPVVTATATSIADAFCIPESNMIDPAIPRVHVTDDDGNTYQWRRYIEDRYNDTRFFGSTWTDGSRGGCKMTAYTNEPLDDDSVNIGIFYRHDELELGKEYGVRITFLADILEGYDSSAGYYAIDARIKLGHVNSTNSSNIQTIWRYTITQQEMIKKGYSTWTITLLDSFTVPDELDDDLPNSLEFSIEMTPFVQNSYIFDASIFDANDTSCEQADPNFPTVLNVVLDHSKDTIQSSTNTTDDGTIADAYCVTNVTLLPDPEFNYGYWEPIPIVYTDLVSNATSDLIFEGIKWIDGSTFGLYLEQANSSVASVSGLENYLPLMYSFAELDYDTYFRVRYAFKVVLADDVDLTQDYTAIQININTTTGGSSDVYDYMDVLYVDSYTQAEIYEYGWNDTVVTVVSEFQVPDFDLYNVTMYAVSAQLLNQDTYIYTFSIYSDLNNTYCNFTDPDYPTTSIKSLYTYENKYNYFEEF